MPIISINTIVIVTAFAVGYMFYIVRGAAQQQLDVYDLVILSMVAVAPTAFVMFPGFAYWLADITGVGFPFVVLFGFLFLILFVFVHRLIVKVHALESSSRLLIQELGLLRQSLDRDGRKKGKNDQQDGTSS